MIFSHACRIDENTVAALDVHVAIEADKQLSAVEEARYGGIRPAPAGRTVRE
jgi:hypothetical protein